MNYVGFSQQGCSGLFSIIDTARSRIETNKNHTILCISDDMLPENCYYEREKEKMLCSDTISFAEVTCEPSLYKIIDMLVINVLNCGFFEMLTKINKLIRDICEKNNILLSALENVIFPNFWRTTWASVINCIGLQCRYEPCTIDTLAHGFSADMVCNLELYEKNEYITVGNYQLVIGFGYGTHLHAMLIERC